MTKKRQSTQTSAPNSNQFGTFGGVFTPSILTILGLIMFMRAGLVTGQAGIYSAILILLISKTITFFTGLSISAISTNAQVKGGGAYFLISRSLGPESGGAIGLTLYLAQAFSVPFYILGFVEALCLTFPSFKGYFLIISLCTAVLLFGINLIGADWALKVQYLILGVLVVALIAFLGGGILHFKTANFQANWAPQYSEAKYSFWTIFAIYFPAVTGIMAGVNMSGDLKDPARSIPRGTLAAIIVGGLVYFLQILICGGAQTRGQLNGSFYNTLFDQALFGLGFFVVAGAIAATISSALGSFMGAPRILQALSRDDIFPLLSPFAKGRAKGDEPVRGLWLTFGLTLLVLFSAGNDSSGGALNVVASILTMFFLYAYGLTNIAAFMESFTKNPSFRPRFRFYNTWTALIGAVGCISAAILIDWKAALAASAILVLLFFIVRGRILSTTFGDVRRGFFYARVRENLYKLASQPHHPKNWRPTTLVLTGNPHTRGTLTQYAVWMESGRGVVTLAEVLKGDFVELIPKRKASLERLQDFIDSNQLAAFPEVLIAEDFDQGLKSLLQCHSIGPLKPNMLMLGWPTNPERIQAFVSYIQMAQKLSKSVVVTVDKGLPKSSKRKKRIDLWWRGHKNGSLMVILAHLITLNPEWSQAHLRILRLINNEEQREHAEAELYQLTEAARVKAEVKVLVSQTVFSESLHEYSSDAAAVLLGFFIPHQEDAHAFHQRYAELVEGLPTTLLVCSSGSADLLA